MTTSYPELNALRNKYSSDAATSPLFAFRDAFKRYVAAKRESLIDLTVAAASLGPEMFGDDYDIDPLVEKAIRETNPNFEPRLFSGFSDEEMTGILNSAKGRYFEYLVTEKLNSGEAVGDLQLPEGYRAVMATNTNQPGWDIQILDTQGHVSEYLQLKATNSLAYIYDTLEKYPDIMILTTDEVAGRADGLVLNSDVTEESLKEQISAAIGELDPSLTGEFISAFNPLMPLVYIAASAGYRILVGKSSVEVAVENAQYRVERSLVACGIGAVVFAIGGGWLAFPVTYMGGAVYDHYREISLSAYSFQESTARLKKYRLHQQERILDRSGYGNAF